MSEKNGPVGMALAGDRYGTEKYERSSERKKRSVSRGSPTAGFGCAPTCESDENHQKLNNVCGVPAPRKCSNDVKWGHSLQKNGRVEGPDTDRASSEGSKSADNALCEIAAL